jgi:hypothetical protein
MCHDFPSFLCGYVDRGFPLGSAAADDRLTPIIANIPATGKRKCHFLGTRIFNISTTICENMQI